MAAFAGFMDLRRTRRPRVRAMGTGIVASATNLKKWCQERHQFISLTLGIYYDNF